MEISTFEEIYKSDFDTAEMYVGENKLGNEIVFTVAEIGNETHEKVQRKYSKQIERSRKNPKRYQAVMAEVLAKSILIDWKGVLDSNDAEVEASFENKKQALIKYKKLFQDVVDFSTDPNNFRDDENLPIELEDEEILTPEEDTEKN